jgi:hypothetical protein
MIATLFDSRPPKDDDAPRPGSNGASAGDQTSEHRTRLPLTPPARHNAPAGTSGVAADRIAGHAKDLRARVLAFIVEQGPHGATDDEAESALGIKPQTYTPRRGELVALGLVVDSRRRRNTASGRPAAVWIAATHADRSPGADGGAA